MKNNESGEVNVLLIVAVLMSVIAVGFAVAFFWAMGERGHYMNDSESIVSSAVADAKTEQEAADKKWHEEEIKKPYLQFKGPADFGSVSFDYPKTWAAYNSETSNKRYEMYYGRQTVPSTSTKSSAFALRVTISDQAYETVLKTYESLATANKATVTPVTVGATDDFAGYNGMRVDGTFDELFNGAAVVFKIRDKTLVLRTDSQDFMSDFNDVVLASIRFTP